MAEINADEPAEFEVEMESLDGSEAAEAGTTIFRAGHHRETRSDHARWTLTPTNRHTAEEVHAEASDPDRVGSGSGSFARRFFPASAAEPRSPSS